MGSILNTARALMRTRPVALAIAAAAVAYGLAAIQRIATELGEEATSWEHRVAAARSAIAAEEAALQTLVANRWAEENRPRPATVIAENPDMGTPATMTEQVDARLAAGRE